MDYYGKRMATCSSDRTIKIFEVHNPDPTGDEAIATTNSGVEGSAESAGAGPAAPNTQQQQPNASSQQLVAQLLGHEGPVWQVAWAHPKFGSILASCSYDRNVIIWKENESIAPSSAPPTSSSSSTTSGSWTKLFQYAGHDLSVNSVAWCSHDYGLILACGSADGTVSVIRYQGGGSGVGGGNAGNVGGSGSGVGHSAGLPGGSGVGVGGAGVNNGNNVSGPGIGGANGGVGSGSGGSGGNGGPGNGGADWHIDRFVAHPMGVNGLSWAPAGVSGSDSSSSSSSPILRLATAGCDNTIKIWTLPLGGGASGGSATAKPAWHLEATLQGHSDWVRDVQWAPSVGLVTSMLASAGQDGQVFIWSQESPNKPQWQRVALDSFGDVVWRVSWSLSGNILAVTSGDSRVTLWKETLDRRQWQQISQLDAS